MFLLPPQTPAFLESLPLLVSVTLSSSWSLFLSLDDFRTGLLLFHCHYFCDFSINADDPPNTWPLSPLTGLALAIYFSCPTLTSCWHPGKWGSDCTQMTITEENQQILFQNRQPYGNQVFGENFLSDIFDFVGFLFFCFFFSPKESVAIFWIQGDRKKFI